MLNICTLAPFNFLNYEVTPEFLKIINWPLSIINQINSPIHRSYKLTLELPKLQIDPWIIKNCQLVPEFLKITY